MKLFQVNFDRGVLLQSPNCIIYVASMNAKHRIQNRRFRLRYHGYLVLPILRPAKGTCKGMASHESGIARCLFGLFGLFVLYRTYLRYCSCLIQQPYRSCTNRAPQLYSHQVLYPKHNAG